MKEIKLSPDWDYSKNIDELLENTLLIYFSKIYGKGVLFLIVENEEFNLIGIKYSENGLYVSFESKYDESCIEDTDPDTICTEKFHEFINDQIKSQQQDTYLLTDFSKSEYKGINIENVKEKLEELNAQIYRYSIGVYGELGKNLGSMITLANASHCIKNIRLEDDKIFGDVKFLGTKNGIIGENYINNLNHEFIIRCTFSLTTDKNHIEEIITQDINND